jgi:hypothetical protein
MTTTDDDSLAAMKQDIAARLRGVCADWPNDLFETMVERLASVTLKYQSETAVPGYDRRTTERLLSDLKAALARSEDVRNREEEKEK